MILLFNYNFKIAVSLAPVCFSHFKGLADGLVAKSCLTLVTPWTVACQAPLSMGFPRQDYWNGLPFPSPGDLPDPNLLHCRQILYQLRLREAPQGACGENKQADSPCVSLLFVRVGSSSLMDRNPS